jgi:GNAT superfamily N-acetyltransferase
MPDVQIRAIAGNEIATFEAMTFPAYRHLLFLEPAPRHPDYGDDKVIQPLGLSAWSDGAAVGLVLAELAAGPSAEMLSLYTRPRARNGGVATALVRALEQVLREKGCEQVSAVYMTGRPGIEALERVLEKCGWSPPVTRTVTLRFTPEQALATPWFARLSLPESEYQIFPWKDLTEEERAELERTQAESPWIATGLEPWRHDRDFDDVSSVGLRYRGQVVGWVINHRIAADTVRFTCSFMREDLARRARILPLYTASIRRLLETGCETCTFVTPVGYAPMVEFVKRRCAPWASFFGETRGREKRLV